MSAAASKDVAYWTWETRKRVAPIRGQQGPNCEGGPQDRDADIGSVGMTKSVELALGQSDGCAGKFR